MQIQLHGLVVQTPKVTVQLWSSWRARQLEHRLFEAIAQIAGRPATQANGDLIITLREDATWDSIEQIIVRVLKGWQEEAEQGSERRSWRWMIEGDRDAYGYDETGEAASLWAFIHLLVENGGPDGQDKIEELELDSFSVRFWPLTSRRS